MSSLTVLVTGASEGIGFALTKRLEAAGYTVIGCARNVAPIEDLKKEKIHAIKCDVSKEVEVTAMFEQINDKLGGLDVVVNNAAATAIPTDATLLAGSPDTWRCMLEVNVIGVCLVTQHAVKSMTTKGGDNCTVLNINSQLGLNTLKLDIPGLGFYSATKHALSGITSALRGELSLQGLSDKIRVMQVSPGLTETSGLARRTNEDIAKQVYSTQGPLQVDEVVDCIMHALSAPKRATIADQVIINSAFFK